MSIFQANVLSPPYLCFTKQTVSQRRQNN